MVCGFSVGGGTAWMAGLLAQGVHLRRRRNHLETWWQLESSSRDGGSKAIFGASFGDDKMAASSRPRLLYILVTF